MCYARFDRQAPHGRPWGARSQNRKFALKMSILLLWRPFGARRKGGRAARRAGSWATCWAGSWAAHRASSWAARRAGSWAACLAGRLVGRPDGRKM